MKRKILAPVILALSVAGAAAPAVVLTAAAAPAAVVAAPAHAAHPGFVYDG